MPPPTRNPIPRPVVNLVPPRSRRPRTAQGRLSKQKEVGELGDDIAAFEAMRGLSITEEEAEEDGERLQSRKSWADRRDEVEHEIRMEAMAERFRTGSSRPTRGTQHDLEPCCRRPVPIRPRSAPPKQGTNPDGTISRRSAMILEYWLEQHKRRRRVLSRGRSQRLGHSTDHRG